MSDLSLRRRFLSYGDSFRVNFFKRPQGEAPSVPTARPSLELHYDIREGGEIHGFL
jgi:hypothetical protein